MSWKETLATACRERAGDALLGIGYYEEGDYEVLYLQEGYEDVYTAERVHDIARDAYLENLSEEFQESLYHEFGCIRATIRLFEGGIVVHARLTDQRGLVFGVADSSLNIVEELLDATDEQIPDGDIGAELPQS
ncbi:DUF7522 family protein [Halospeciosus flavus]|uniref:Roadblock/LAMTOR2 domain-containing protein n=1 Tax=Halospeciosus flavus TaxID=3032283 RepID=A0ABD5Z5Y1_9EURY|nr:hypothetical protein [Halospeciosus flavus]